MKIKIDDKILEVLSDANSYSEWDIAFRLYDWNDSELRSKHGAWIRSIVQALWRLWQENHVGYFWVSHGEGVPSSRMWFRSKE